ncbi:MAG: ABC transporter permease [Bacteroidota bacterium]|nr:ABC transporter permease [Bacteroidota bacterium]
MLLQNIYMAIESIKQNLVRFIITSLIISIGIMALVGMLTAIDSIKAGLTSQYSILGANSFNIRNRGSNISFSERRQKPKEYVPISYQQASDFKNKFKFPSTVAISITATQGATVVYESYHTNPNMMVFGGDVDYINAAGFKLENGRNFSGDECDKGNHVCIIGKDIQNKLFKSVDPIGKFINISSIRYKVVGAMASRGSSIGFGGDRMLIVPILNARSQFPRPNVSCVITVAVDDIPLLDVAVAEAAGAMRPVRNLKVLEENNFEIMRSDAVTQKLIENLGMVTIAATFIALITLLGAAVGLMNILLVSVNERTREIGTRKALGATKRDIRWQFLTEAMVICVLGGLGGILLGIGLGNLVGRLVDSPFIMPWGWTIMGIIICLLVGLLSGWVPANRAAKLAPVEALRHE